MEVKFTDTSEEAINGLFEAQKQALRASAKVVKKAVKEACPVATGNLKKNIATWVRANRKTGEVSLQIGVYDAERAKKKGLKYAFYAHMVEFGTSKRRARAFIKPTVVAKIPEIRAEQAKYLPNIEILKNFNDTDEEVAGDV